MSPRTCSGVYKLLRLTVSLKNILKGIAIDRVLVFHRLADKVSDIEEETNGLLTYDRRINKLQ